MDFHLTCLAKSCRICGRYKSQKNNDYEYNCSDSDIRIQILSVYEVDINDDHPSIHPPKLCNNCYAKCLKKEKNPSYQPAEPLNWEIHRDECKLCEKFTDKQRGGRKRKMTGGRGRPKKSYQVDDDSEKTSITICNEIIPPSIIDVMPEIDRFRNPPSDLVCPICKDIFDQPIQSSCQHYFCYGCVHAWLEHAGERSRCPVCTETMYPSTLSRAPRVLLNILNSLPVKCASCKFEYPLDKLQRHEMECKKYIAQPCSTTLPQILDTPMTIPLSSVEEDLTTHLMKRKIHTTSFPQVALKTGGSVSTYNNLKSVRKTLPL